MNDKLLFFIVVLFFSSCMPEENLPIRDVGEAPEYFIECYCKAGAIFSLSATTVLPVSKDLKVDFSKKMDVTIFAGKDIELLHSLYTLPGSDFIYNYGSKECFDSAGLDSLSLFIMTADGKRISSSTFIPSPVSIHDCRLENKEVCVSFYTSELPEENYYIYVVEAMSRDIIVSQEVCYLDDSDVSSSRLIEKRLILPNIQQADQVVVNLKRITKANYEYQISLSVANSANQSSITTPVPLKGNLSGALGIFTCYTEDRRSIEL
ncbi:MAG: DUF4249 family protein [Odoribacter sp.]